MNGTTGSKNASNGRSTASSARTEKCYFDGGKAMGTVKMMFNGKVGEGSSQECHSKTPSVTVATSPTPIPKQRLLYALFIWATFVLLAFGPGLVNQ